MIKKLKIYITILVMVILIGIFVFAMLKTNIRETIKEGNATFAGSGDTLDDVTDTLSEDMKAIAIGDKALIDSVVIEKRVTGTAPWDDNNEPGNDNSGENNIVRSFDQVTWTLNLNMELKEGVEVNSLKGGIIEFEVILPENCANVMEWNLNEMIWVENGEISEDGRILTGNYIMQEDEITIPGQQTLVFVVKVEGAANKTEIEPTFKFKLTGNDEGEEVETTAEKVLVSATGKYNIQLHNNPTANNTTVDYGEGNVKGKMYGYGFTVQLYNEDEIKGLKGIEYPQGEISFDIDLKLEKSKYESSELEDITEKATPILWNYRENNSNSEDLSGKIEGRDMYASSLYDSDLPFGINTGNRDYSTYNSGDIQIIQNGRTLHVTIENYDFAKDFPRYIYKDNNRTKIYTDNIGTFIVGYMQIFVPKTEETTIADMNYYLTISDNNMKIQSSMQENNEQMDTSDDSITRQHTNLSIENYNHTFYLLNQLEGELGRGKGTVLRGQKIQMKVDWGGASKEADYIRTINKLVKFDASAFQITKYDDGDTFKSDGNKLKYKMYYATKPDGTNWISQTEMNDTQIDSLKVYTTLEEIPSNEKCVGVYFESQSGEYQYGWEILKIPLLVRDTAVIGKTYGFTQSTIGWNEYLDREIYTALNDKVEWVEPTFSITNRKYIKTEYDENGQMIAGTHSGDIWYGNTLLVVGAKLHGNIRAVDSTDTIKTNYDIGKNENVVKYSIEPQLDANENLLTQIENITLKVEVTIPNGLTYIAGSSKRGEEWYTDPEITENEDESRTLVWHIYAVTSGQEIAPIIFEAQIDYDSSNNAQYITKFIVSEEVGEGEITKIGNSEISTRTSSTTINIINLSRYRIYKETTSPIIEINGEARYKVTYQNNADTSVPDFQLLDILPYNGDSRGTSYNGTYKLKNIQVTQKGKEGEISTDNLSLYITTSEEARKLTAKDVGIGIDEIWKKIEIGTLIDEEIVEGVTAIALKGGIEKNTNIEIEITLQTGKNESGDIYYNSATAQTSTMADEIRTTNIRIQVVKRQIEGMIWYDTNENGMKDAEESYASRIEVELKKADGSKAVDCNGNEIENILTDSNGRYSFSNLPKAEYIVEIKTEDKYILTEANVGSNIEVNSKFKQTEKGEKQSYTITKLNGMQSPEIIEEHVNAGLVVKDAKIIVKYLEEDNTPETDEDNNILRDQEEITTYEKDGIQTKYKLGDSYNIQAADIENYVTLRNSSNTSGTLNEEETFVTYYYTYNKQDIDVTKVWEDNEDSAGKRPTSIKIELKNGNDVVSEKVLSDQNKITDTGEFEGISDTAEVWQTTIEDVTIYDENGDKINYTIDEKENEGTLDSYIKTIRGMTITNTFTQNTEKTQVQVVKKWEDNNNVANKRPPSLILVLKKELKTKNNQTEYQEVTRVVINGTDNQGANSNEWTYTFGNIAKYDENNDEIKYIVEEIVPEFYTSSVKTVESGEENTIKEFEITNTFKVPEDTINVEVTKIWNDNNNKAGKRPESTTLVLTGNGKENKIILTKSNEVQGQENIWKGTISDLPKYDENANIINYELREENLNNIFYTEGNTIINQQTKTVTNKFEVPDDKIGIEVNKKWDDENNALQRRPEEVTLYLTGNNQEYEITLNESNKRAEDETVWSGTISNLPKYDVNGDEITYQVDERPIANEFYTKTGIEQGTKTVTNTFAIPTETIQITVTKKWEDSNNKKGYRPENVVLQIKEKETGKVVSEQMVSGNKTTNEGWTYTFEVPKYNDQGEVAEYEIGERELQNKFYPDEEVQIDQENKIITNVFEVPDDQIEILVNKIWKDNEIQAKRRPKSIILAVKNGDQEVKTVEMTKDNLVKGTTNQWAIKIDELAKYDDEANEIQYTIEEKEKVQGDLKFYEAEENNVLVEDNQATIRNNFVTPEEKTSVTVTKEWEDNNNESQKRPTSIKIQVKNGENVVQEKEVNVDNWTCTFTDLQKYDDNGEEINYTVQEKEVNENDLKFYINDGATGNMTDGYTITNRFNVPDEKIELTINKIWSDNDVQAKRRPNVVVINVKDENGDIVDSYELNTETDESHTFTNLKKYNNEGDEIQYTVEETEKEEGDLKFYTTTIGGIINVPNEENKKQVTITNTFKKPNDVTNITVTKEWKDNNNEAQKRPASIKIQLKNGNTVRDEREVSGSSTEEEWQYTFEGVEKYNENGEEIVYTADETEVNSNDLQFYNKKVDGTTITNTFTQNTDTVDVQINKKWEDNEIQAQRRPESVIIVLKANGKEEERYELSEKTAETANDNTWTYTFAGLRKYDEYNNIINYTVEEEKNTGDLKFYTSKVEGTTITNTFTRPADTISIEVNKQWVDQENVYEKRPVSVKIEVKNGGTLSQDAIITKEDEWKTTFTGLAKYDDNGQEIQYTVEEKEVLANDLSFYEGQVGETTNKPGETDKKEVTITNTMTKIPSTVVVKYIDKNTGEEISGAKTKEGIVGEKFDVTEDEKEIAGYTKVGEPEEKTGVYTTESQEKIYYYAKNTKVIVKYLEKDDTPEDTTNNKVLAKEKEIQGYEGKEYTTTEEKVEGYTLTGMPDNASGKMGREDIEVIYYYSQNTKVTVKYLEQDETPDDTSDNKVLETEEIEGYEGKDYKTEEKQIENYTYVGSTENTEGTMTKEPIEVIYYYAKNTKVVVKYLEQDETPNDNTDNNVLATEEINGYVGKDYNTEEKKFDNYTFVKSTENTKGTMTEETIEVIYYYAQNTKVTIQHIDKVTGKVIKETIETGKVGDVIETKAEDIEGYVLVEEPKDSTIVMDKTGNQIVKYYYAHISEGIIEKHIDEITGELLYSKEHKGNEGEHYKITSKEFEGYDLVTEKLPENAEGEMTQELIEVKYYYIKKAKVIVKYLDEDNKEIAKQEIIEGHENDNYETKEKEIKGYNLVKTPENATGKMKVTKNEDGTLNAETEVIYYYKKQAGGVIESHIDITTNKVMSTEEHTGNIGDEYNIPSKEFEGYDLVTEKMPENAKGKMTEEKIEVKYYYIKQTKVKVEYIDKLTGEKLDIEEIKGHIGEKYETEEKEFDGYDLVEKPSNSTGKMTGKEIVVKYYYEKKAEVEIKYLEKGTEYEIAESKIIEGYVGDKYNAEQVDIPYYNYIEKTKNYTGKMEEEKTTVIFYYEKQVFNLKVDKWVSNVKVNAISQGGQEIEEKDEIYKVEINRHKAETANIKIKYKIRVTNKGEVEGTAGKIIDILPTGYSYYQEDNDIYWEDKDGVLETDALKDETIEPGKYKEIEVVLRWEKGAENFGQKDNIVIISEEKNPANYEDTNRDDNNSRSSMIIGVATGLDINDKFIFIEIVQLIIVLIIGLMTVYDAKKVKK